MTDYAGHTAEALRALCAGATSGPWYVHNPDDEMCMNAYAVTTSPVEPCVDAYPPNDHAQIVALTLLQAPRVVCHEAGKWEEDARFIAAARLALPATLDRVAALEAENARLRDDAQRANNLADMQTEIVRAARRVAEAVLMTEEERALRALRELIRAETRQVL